MPKRGENIYKRKDGRYEARYVKKRDYNNRIIEYGFVYGKTYTEAKIKKNIAIKNLDTISIYDYNSFNSSIDSWLSLKKSIKQTTYYNYISIVNSSIKPYFKGKRMHDITNDEILEFIDYLYSKKLSNKRIRDILLVLNQFLKYKKINVDIPYPKLDKKILEVLNNDEIKIIKNKLISSNIKDFSIVLTMYTGLRIGELCALKWEDINIEKQEIYITKTLSRIKNNNVIKTRVVLDKPKTQTSVRIVPIIDELVPYLKNLKFNKADQTFVLTGTDKFMTYHAYYNYYKDKLSKLHIKNYTFHILRHTFASKALMSGVDIKTLSEVLGHSSVKITLDRYVHISKEEKLKQINKISLNI